MILATSLGTVMMPRIASIYAKGNSKKISEYMNQSFTFILLLAFPIMFGLISISSHFVPVFYGEGYEKVVPLLCIMSPIIVLIGLSNVTGTQYLLPTKQQNKYTLSVVIGAIVNFILNFILIRYYKSIGAAIATVVAELVVTSIQFYLIRKKISLIEVLKISNKYIIASFIMFIISLISGYLISNNFLAVIIQIFVSIIIYFSMLLLLKDKFLIKVINTIKKKFNK